MTRSFHMPPEEFRAAGKQLIDWIADYYEQVGKYPVMSKAAPGEIRATLPAEAPARGARADSILEDLLRKILPGITHWQSPSFFGYFPANSSEPSVLGDLLSAGLGVQGMLWATSPACTEVETHVLDWLVKMLDLPTAFLSTGRGGGVIQDSTFSASLTAIIAARERVTNYASNEEGCRQELVAYTSSQAHSSIEKDIKIAGIGSRNLRVIEADGSFAMKPDKLAEAIAADEGAGRKPFLVCATTGTTLSLAFDPLDAIGEICKRHGLWLHVDAAMAGTAALCPEFRYIHRGLDLADSYCFDAHKWMFTNFDCTCFYVAEREHLIRSLTVVPEYLRNQATESGTVFDYRDWHVPLGRRFRALKLWFVINSYGVEGLQFHIRRHVELAQEFAEWLKGDTRFEVMAPAALNLVCFRMKGDDARTEELMKRLNRGGELFVSHTRLNGKFTIRFCVGQTRTEIEHVRHAWECISREAERL